MEQTVDQLWRALQAEAVIEVEREPLLSSFYHATIVSHVTMRAALSYLLAEKLSDAVVPAVAAADAHLHLPQRNLEFVVGHDHALRGNAVVAQQRPDGRSGASDGCDDARHTRRVEASP